MVISHGSTGRSLNMGVDENLGGYIQSAYVNNAGVAQNLAINPVGGNVGIGTKTPIDKLTVIDNNPNGSVLHIKNESATGDGIYIQIMNPNTDENNEFVTFANGQGHQVGRIEGFQDSGSLPSMPANTPIESWMWTTNHSQLAIGIRDNLLEDLKIPQLSTKLSKFPDAMTLGIDFPPLTTNALGLANDFFGSGTYFNLPKHNITFTPSWGEYVTNPGNIGFKVPKYFNQIASGNLPFTQTQLQNLVCWGLTNGYEDFIGAEPEEIAMTALLIRAKDICNDDGVTYGSKGADYAEWLPKADSAYKFPFGSIVGLKDGMISINTDSADQIMIVSQKPVVLGNLPPEGQENRYEKVGFMGQLMTLVTGGAEPGDYIIPSGNNDGYAIAISPEDVTIEDIPKIAGKAWSSTDNNYADYVNVAVGLSTGEMAVIMQKQQEKMAAQAEEIEKLKTDNAEIEARLSAIENAPIVKGKRQIETVSVEKYNELLERLKMIEASLSLEAKK